MRKPVLLVIILLTLAAVATMALFRDRGCAAASGTAAVFYVGQSTYVANGQSRVMDVAPFIQQGRTYVPVRYLGYALGVEDSSINWDGATGTVILAADGTTLKLTVGKPALMVNLQEKTMDAAPLLRDDRVFLPARWIAEALGYKVSWDQASMAVLVAPHGQLPDIHEPLPVVGSYENLKKLLARASEQAGTFHEPRQESLERVADSTAKSTKAPAGAGTSPEDYSRTNVQVEGVDEADVVKSDGRYIYQVNKERLLITRAYPAKDMRVVSSIGFERQDISPLEIYVDDRYLVVIGITRGHIGIPRPEPLSVELDSSVAGCVPAFCHRPMVKAVVYSIEDKSNISMVRELQLDGEYVSSRKTGRALYLVAKKPVWFYSGQEITDPRPSYRDSAVHDGLVEIDYMDIKCFPNFLHPSYLLVAGLDLGQPDQEARVSAYLGSGENVFSSAENMYIAVTTYRYGSVAPDLMRRPIPWPEHRDSTSIYKFALDSGRITYTASGEVPGRVLNQFSMDEHKGYFRVATTSGEVWRTDEQTSKNNVYILDLKMEIAGKIENIAPGEMIYSARFMGDRGYMVTFRTVDPFFVLDLKDPRQPRILGILKIPGYSDYLHPYDENHIIGFGKDTIEIGIKNGWSGSDSMAFYQGLKMALFDVSDVNNPVEKFKYSIGDRGTDSELLRNHRALLFSREKNLLAFPVTLMEIKGGSSKPDSIFPDYGQFTFQGAYIFSIDKNTGFSLRERITHISQEDYLKAGYYWYHSDKNVERILYIGDTLYTLSNRYIIASRLADLVEINRLPLPQ